MKIPFSPPDITESEITAVTNVLKSGWITTGPVTKQFEKEISNWAKTEKTACLASATIAMELALRMYGIGPGDEVITSAYTYTASASVIFHTGAKIVLCDTSSNSYEMDYEKLPCLINEKTKAIIAVDVAGKMCDYKRLFDIATQKKSIFNPSSEMQESFGRILIIADAAHSIGADRDGINSGAYADFTAFSFHAVKNITTAEGGALTWRTSSFLDSEKVYKNLMLLSLHGQNKDAFSKSKAGAWDYDIIEPLYKCNMSDLHAALGLSQFLRYKKMLSRRRSIIEMYEKNLLPEIKLLKHFENNNNSSGHLMLTRINKADEQKRNRAIEKFTKAGISVNVHYKPLPMLTAYKNLGFDIENFQNAYNMYKNELTLPLHSMLTDEEVGYISETYNNIIKC